MFYSGEGRKSADDPVESLEVLSPPSSVVLDFDVNGYTHPFVLSRRGLCANVVGKSESVYWCLTVSHFSSQLLSPSKIVSHFLSLTY